MQKATVTAIAVGTLLVGLAIGYGIGAHNKSATGHDMQNMSMAEMMASMNATLTDKTGTDFEQAFLSEMIAHHQGAVEMAQMVLQKTTRPELVELANGIIAAQNSEISQMKQWLQTWFARAEESAAPATGMRVEDNAIVVSGQGETNTLAATMVVLTDPGYVVVHEDANGQPGKVIGTSKLVASGMAHGVSVPLSRTAIKGEKLYAMLHQDNGDGVYSEADAPVASRTGDPIMMTVTVEAGSTPSGDGAISI